MICLFFQYISQTEMKNKKHQSRWMSGYIRGFLFSLQRYNRFYKLTSRFTKKTDIFFEG